MERLLRKKVEPGRTTECDGRTTPLHVAQRTGFLPVVKYLTRHQMGGSTKKGTASSLNAADGKKKKKAGSRPVFVHPPSREGREAGRSGNHAPMCWGGAAVCEHYNHANKYRKNKEMRTTNSKQR